MPMRLDEGKKYFLLQVGIKYSLIYLILLEELMDLII